MTTTVRIDSWRAWTPEGVGRVLAGVDAPWCFVGGWALELWDARLARPHGDIEIVVPRARFAAVRERLERDHILYAHGGGTQRRLAPADPFPRDKNQCWVAEGDVWRLDVMLDAGDADRWVYRRDERISAPRGRMVRTTPGGLPYLAPQAVLLFKARGARPKDETDFASCLPLLDGDARAWLHDALAVTDPGHRWLARLGGDRL